MIIVFGDYWKYGGFFFGEENLGFVKDFLYIIFYG